jgi:hypothetical protein
MLFWIVGSIALVIGLIGLVAYVMDDLFGPIEKIAFGFLAIPLGALILAMVGFGTLAISFLPAHRSIDHSHDSSCELQAIQMGQGVSGRFYLGSGVINDENVFTYYCKTGENHYQSGRVQADYADVIESDTQTPRLIEHRYYWPWWVMPQWLTDGIDMGGTSWTIYVPKGSIKPMVDMSLPN